VQGLNSNNQVGYIGPAPPPGSGKHRYFFKMYALDVKLELGINKTKKDVEEAMKGHILAKGELIGLYTR